MKVRIRIMSTQTGADGQPMRTRNDYEGSCCREGGSFVCVYRESTDGGEEIRTRMEIGQGSLILERRGAFSSRMVFREGEDHAFLYETPFGALPMTLHTDRAEAERTRKSIHVKVAYTLDMDASERTSCMIRIRIDALEGFFI